jgi:integrase
MSVLADWRRLTGPELSPYVFANPSNLQTHLKGVRKTWARALKDAQIGFFPIYNLRATFASRLSAAGVPDVFVSQMMGHAGWPSPNLREGHHRIPARRDPEA